MADNVTSTDLVKLFLRAHNLEQVGRMDEAVEMYETAVANAFDSSGPYDRLIAIYANRAGHRDVVRVAEAALQHVHTYDDKKKWYRTQRDAAIKAQERLPRAAPKTRPAPRRDRPDER